MNEILKRKLFIELQSGKLRKIFVVISSLIIVGFLLSAIVYANTNMNGTIKVNEKKLQELDSMYNIKVNRLEKEADEYGIIYENDHNGYEQFQNELGISLLCSNLSAENPYMIGKIKTDNKDFAILTCENYILGDTLNYKYNQDEGFYVYEAGPEYNSPISLEVDIMLSENQMKNGWDTDYLGMYQLRENYISSQGYIVNIIEDTIDDRNNRNYISQKCAVFVVDGIRYTLKGRTSLENIKYIVDNMKYKN